MSTVAQVRMRYCTRTAGPEARAAERRYQEHLAGLATRLAPPVREFALQRNTHDALFQKVRWNPGARVLEFLFRAGNGQDGYFDLLLRYHGARICAPSPLEFERILQDPLTRVLCDEFDLADDSFVHRWLLGPAGEVEVAFADLHVGRLERASNFFEQPAERFEIVSC